MKKRKLIFLVGSLLTSLVIVFTTNSWLRTSPQKSSLGSQTYPILIAPENLPEGAIMTVEKMAWQEWGLDRIEDDYLKQTDNSRLSEVEGGVVRTPIFKGEPICVSKIIKTHGKSAIAAIIHEGMRAVTIPYSKLANAPSLIAPGDVVDVIIPKKNQENSDAYFGQTILSSVQILAVNNELQKGGGDEKISTNAQTITLEVTAPQAEDLAGAIRDGQVVISMQSIFAKSASRSLQGTLENPDKAIPAPQKAITIIRGSERKI